MKRLIALFLTLMLLMASAAMADGGEAPLTRLTDMTLYVRELIWGDYLPFRGVPEDVQNRAKNWSNAIDGTPDLVVRLDIDGCPTVQEYRALFAAEHEMVSYEAQSTGMMLVLTYAMIEASYESLLADMAYEQTLEVNIAVNAQTMYADATAEDGASLYLVMYEGAQPLMVYTVAENGAVQMVAYFLPSSTLAACTSYAQVAMWFMRWGCPITGEMVSLE